MFQVTLTFDNGPDPEVTPAVLDTLGRAGLRATFFVLGEKPRQPDCRVLAERAFAEGHWIGNHTFTHGAPLGESREAGTVEREIGETQAPLGGLAHPDRLFRPVGGGGRLGRHLLSPEALDYLKAGEFSCVLWTSVPEDWLDPVGWVERAMADCRTRDWSVVVVHDLPTGAMDHLDRFIALFFILEGTYELVVDGETSVAGPGHPSFCRGTWCTASRTSALARAVCSTSAFPAGRTDISRKSIPWLPEAGSRPRPSMPSASATTPIFRRPDGPTGWERRPAARRNSSREGRMLSGQTGAAPVGPPLLEVDGVTVRFGGLVALDGVSLAVRPGEIFGLIGPNGAGKTTLFNCITRLYDIRDGAMRLSGRRIDVVPTRAVPSLGIARTVQNLGLYPSMSVLENVMPGAHHTMGGSILRAIFRPWAAGRREREVRDRCQSILSDLGLEPVAAAAVSSLPFATLKRIEIARAPMPRHRFPHSNRPASKTPSA